MKCPKYDFHIHTKYLGCANATMEVPAIIKECERLGVTALGITDHLNHFDQLDLHIPIKEDISKLDTQIKVYFGVELNYTEFDKPFAFSEEIKEQYSFQFAIGGPHSTYLEEYDLRKLVDFQHKHHLKACEDPLVQVLVHPYWFNESEFVDRGFPWFDSMKAVPESYARELGQAAKETGTVIEINGYANLSNLDFSEDYVKEYVEYLSIIAEEGVKFSVCSDSHDIGHITKIRHAWRVAEQLGLSEDRIWRPECEPFAGGL